MCWRRHSPEHQILHLYPDNSCPNRPCFPRILPRHPRTRDHSPGSPRYRNLKFCEKDNMKHDLMAQNLIETRPLQWRHNERDGVSNHQSLDCLHNRLFRSKKTPKLCVTGLCEVNPPVTGGFTSQRASNVQNVFMWWRHHVTGPMWGYPHTGVIKRGLTLFLSFT